MTNHSVGVEPATYAVQSEHITAEQWRPFNMVVIFTLLTYMAMGKEKCKKNKTNTDHNPTTNPNPKPTIDKAAHISSGQKSRASASCIDTL